MSKAARALGRRSDYGMLFGLARATCPLLETAPAEADDESRELNAGDSAAKLEAGKRTREPRDDAVLSTVERPQRARLRRYRLLIQIVERLAWHRPAARAVPPQQIALVTPLPVCA